MAPALNGNGPVAQSPGGSRARGSGTQAYLERDRVRIRYDVYGDGDGEPAILFVPTWSIVHSRIWKLQVADLASVGARFDRPGPGPRTPAGRAASEGWRAMGDFDVDIGVDQGWAR